MTQITESKMKENDSFKMNGIQRISPSLSEKLSFRQVMARTQAGFTVMEMMVVIAILGILAGIAIPSFQTWREHSAVNNATTSLFIKLKQARSLAVADTRKVKVSFDTVNKTFTYDDNNGGACVNCENIVVALSQFSPNLALTTRANASITFKSTGVADNDTIKLVLNGYYKCIVVNIIGRAYIQDASNASPTCINL